MLRRVAASLALVGVLTGCATFSDGDAIARVDDVELSEDLLDDLLDDLPALGGQDAGSPTGTGQSADAARQLIFQWIQIEVARNHLAEIGIPIEASAIADAEAALDADPSIGELTGDVREWTVDAQSVIITFNSLPDPAGSFDAAVTESDVYVDARYGFFEPQFGVVPVGVGLGVGL